MDYSKIVLNPDFSDFFLSTIIAKQNVHWVAKQNLSALAHTLLIVAQLLEGRETSQLACSWYRTKTRVSKAVFVAHMCVLQLNRKLPRC